MHHIPMPVTTRSKRRRMKSEPEPEPGPPARPNRNAASTSAIKNEEKSAPSDLDVAFELQMREAIAASTLVSDPATDFYLVEDEMRRMREDFDLQLHDRKVASEISSIPDNEWEATGDDYHRPYPKKAKASTSSSSSIGGDLGLSEHFSMYCKGISVDTYGIKSPENFEKFGAVGVAIFDSTNAVVFEVSKPLVLPKAEMKDKLRAELEAFVHGLEFAFSLELKRLVYCVDFDVDRHIDENQKQKPKYAELGNRIGLLKGSFEQCYPSDASNNNNAQFVLGLARSSIAKQVGKPVNEIFITKEQCPICLENVDSTKIYETGNCKHRFCSSCIQKHIEIKVRGRELPHCPLLNCGIAMNADSCKKFLAPKLYNVMLQLVKESSIPTAEKVYCPNPRCSNLMSRTEALASTNNYSSIMCLKCRSQFCIDCKVLWHSNMSCDEYRKRKLDPRSADDNLQQLAGNKKWRQCPMCSHMVELALGCNHIYCRCGHQFCYVCGLEWKNKKPTCKCQLWAEENIIRQ